MTEPITVHLIDDDEAVLDSLGLYLESKGIVICRYRRAEPFLETLARPTATECVVSDVRMPGITGLDLQRELARRGSAIPLILITGHGDIDMAVTAVKAGAHDFLEKPFDERRLLASIMAAIAATRQRQTSAKDLTELADRRAELSERQQQVMDLAAQGRTNKEIGVELGISPRTVEIYRAKVMERMGTATLADLVRVAVRLEDSSKS